MPTGLQHIYGQGLCTLVLQPEEEAGEAELHAWKPAAAWVGETSEGLALEQLGILLSGDGIDSGRCRGVGLNLRHPAEKATSDPRSNGEPGAPGTRH